MEMIQTDYSVLSQLPKNNGGTLYKLRSPKRKLAFPAVILPTPDYRLMIITNDDIKTYCTHEGLRPKERGEEI